MSIAENISDDICVSVLSARHGFAKVIRKYTLRDQIAGPRGGYRIDHTDKCINGCCSYNEAFLKATAFYGGKIYTTIRNYIDPPILNLTDLKEMQI